MDWIFQTIVDPEMKADNSCAFVPLGISREEVQVERMRKSYPPSFKAKVALEAIKEQKTSAELASLYQVHPGQIRNWKAVVLKGLLDLFSDRQKRKEQDNETLIAELYRQIGQQKVDLDWLKKNLELSHRDKVSLIENTNIEISISHQAELLGISRSSIYYKPVVDEYDILLMRMIDEQYTQTPFYGSMKMCCQQI